jgi:hypothetical protein
MPTWCLLFMWQDATPDEIGRMLGVHGCGDTSLPRSALGHGPGSDAFDDPSAMLHAVAAEQVTVFRILLAAGLPLPEQALNALAGVHERRELALERTLGEGGTHTRARASLSQEHEVPVKWPNVLPAMLSMCHQSIQAEVSGGHIDTMGGGSGESKLALTDGGGGFVHVELGPCGSLQLLPLSALHFPKYGVATLLSAPGPSPADCDVEISACTAPSALHKSRNPTLTPTELLAREGEVSRLRWSRGAFVRSLMRVYIDGTALCDHPGIGRGSAEWFRRIRARPSVGSARRARAVLALPNGIHAWRHLAPPQQHALAQLQ